MPDLDNDGWPDIVFVTGNVYPEVEKYFNQYPHRGPRFVFRNLGNGKFEDLSVVTVGERSQAQAVLSQSSYYSHDDLRLHFGLGEKTKADRVTVFWPSGQTDTFRDVPANQVVTIKEGIGLKP